MIHKNSSKKTSKKLFLQLSALSIVFCFITNTSSMERSFDGNGDDLNKAVMSPCQSYKEGSVKENLQNKMNFFHRVNTSDENLHLVNGEIQNAACYELLLTNFPSSSNQEVFYNACRDLYQCLVSSIIVSRIEDFEKKDCNSKKIVNKWFLDEGCTHINNIRDNKKMKSLFTDFEKEFGPIKSDNFEIRFRNGRLHISIEGYAPNSNQNLSQLFTYSLNRDEDCCATVVYDNNSEKNNPFILSSNSLLDNTEENLKNVRD